MPKPVVAGGGTAIPLPPTAPIAIPDYLNHRSSSQLSSHNNLTASLTSLPASLPPYPSGMGGATGGLGVGSNPLAALAAAASSGVTTGGSLGAAAFPSSIPPSYPSEISISSLPTILPTANQNNTAAATNTTTSKINPEALLLLKRDDLDAFLSKASIFYFDIPK